MKAYLTVPHGDPGCMSKVRFWCVVCFRLACECTGCADDVDCGIAMLYNAPVPTSDPSICDECHSAMAKASGTLHAVHVILVQVTAELVLPLGYAPGVSTAAPATRLGNDS